MMTFLFNVGPFCLKRICLINDKIIDHREHSSQDQAKCVVMLMLRPVLYCTEPKWLMSLNRQATSGVPCALIASKGHWAVPLNIAGTVGGPKVSKSSYPHIKLT